MHGHTRKKLASRTRSLVVLGMLVCPGTILAQRLEVITVEGQPLAANVERVVRALESLGHRCRPRPSPSRRSGRRARRRGDPATARPARAARRRPSTRRRASRSAAGRPPAVLQQGGYTPVLVKVVNEAATTKPLRITSPQSGPVFAGRGRPEHDAAGPDCT